MQNWKEDTIWHGLSLNTIYNMDCIEGMKMIPDGSIDAIITDPPYWTTACKRDTVIPFDLMREQLKRIIKPNGAIVLFGSEPFSSALRMSNIKQYKYDWKWEKSRNSNPFLAKKQPLRHIEDIIVFWKWTTSYYPQMEQWEEYTVSSLSWWRIASDEKKRVEWFIWYKQSWRFPKNIIKFQNPSISGIKHPTQKPVALIEYLVKTYTNEWETVLDFTMWSWTTVIACINTNRNFIWFELDEWYRNIANKRIQDKLSEK